MNDWIRFVQALQRQPFLRPMRTDPGVSVTSAMAAGSEKALLLLWCHSNIWWQHSTTPIHGEGAPVWGQRWPHHFTLCSAEWWVTGGSWQDAALWGQHWLHSLTQLSGPERSKALILVALVFCWPTEVYYSSDHSQIYLGNTTYPIYIYVGVTHNYVGSISGSTCLGGWLWTVTNDFWRMVMIARNRTGRWLLWFS